MILGNKMDLSHERKVSKRDGEQFSNENNFIFREVTATEPGLVHDAFVALLEAVVPHRMSI